MKYNKKTLELREKKLEIKKNRKKQKCKLILLHASILFLLLIVAIIGGTGIGVFRGLIASAPVVSEISLEPSGYMTSILDSKGKTIQKLSDYTSNRISVESDQIPKNLKNAFIAIEDVRFYEHKGIDIRGMIRALFANIVGGGIKEGASTITQQVIKNNVFNAAAGESDLFAKVERKIQEQHLALQVEKKFSKSEILKNYLNTINLGQGALGVQSASNTYFNKDVSDLTLSECAVLASITRSPSYYDPLENPENNKERMLRVLEKMLAEEMISQEEYDAAVADDVYERIQKVDAESTEDNVYSYFVDAVIKQAVEDLQANLGCTQTQAYNMLYSGGLTIHTTQDTEIQNVVDSVVSNESNYPSSSGYALTYRLSLLKPDGKAVNYSEYDVVRYMKEHGRKSSSIIYSSKNQAKKDVEKFRASVVEDGDKVTGESYSTTIQPQASVTIIDQKTGYVKAMSGGRGEKTSNLSLNRATDSARQPGSTFKVLAAFLPALDTKGMTLSTVYDDSPYNYEGTSDPVNNYYSSYYRGLCTVRDAITWSLNIVTAKTMADVTPKVGYDYLMKLGFTTLVEHRVDSKGKVHSDIVQPLALGGITDGVTNLELTAAYAAIANKGVYVKPVLYTKIVDREGNVIFETEKTKNRVMKESTAWLLTNAMKDVLRKGTGTAASLSTGMPAAGKSGTTTGDVDFWFSGYTPYYTASVWMGYDVNTTFSGSTNTKAMWRKIMDGIIREKGLKYKDFSSCDDIVSRTICKKSGLLAVDGVCNLDKESKTVITEYYVKGTQPTKKCNLHTKVTICKESKLPFGEFCPEECKEDAVYLLKEEKKGVKTWDTELILPKEFKEKTCDKHDEKTFLESIKDLLNPTDPEATTTKKPETTTTKKPETTTAKKPETVSEE